MGKMGWFLRRNHKRSRSGANLSDENLDLRSQTRQTHPPTTVTMTPHRQTSIKRRKTNKEPSKERRSNRTLSFSPGREDRAHIQAPRCTSRNETCHAQDQSQNVPSRLFVHQPTLHALQSLSQPTAHYETPTLRAPSAAAAGQAMRVGSKRHKKIDRAREAEIRALSGSYDDTRPLSEQLAATNAPKRLSRRARRDITSSTSDVSLRYAPSMTSMMSVESERAAVHVTAIHTLSPRPTLKYSTPRDTSVAAGAGVDMTMDAAGPSRTRSERKKRENPPIAENTLHMRDRIDDLVNELTTSDIRELMERDKRRRALKKQQDQARLQRRLQRAHEEEQLRQCQGRATSPNLDRGVVGRELAGLGVPQPTSAIVTSSRQRQPNITHNRPDDMEIDHGHLHNAQRSSTASSQPRPLEQFYSADSMELQEDHDDQFRHESRYMVRHNLPTPPPDNDRSCTRPLYFVEDEEEISPAVAATIAAASGFPQHKSSIKRRKSDRRVLVKKERVTTPTMQVHENRLLTPPSTTKRVTPFKSHSPDDRGSRFSWSGLFRWRTKGRRVSAETPSFSNTSRDSMGAGQMPPRSSSPTPYLPPSVAAPNITFIPPHRAVSGVAAMPKYSRFLEDLPETEMASTPQPRVNSPTGPGLHYRTPTIMESPVPRHHSPKYTSMEAVRPMPLVEEEKTGTPSLRVLGNHETYDSEPNPARCGNKSPYEGLDSTTSPSIRSSMTGAVADQQSRLPQSVSLASFESEGSWLSGGLGAGRRRVRVASQQSQRSLTRLPRHVTSQASIRVSSDGGMSSLGHPDCGPRSSYLPPVGSSESRQRLSTPSEEIPEVGLNAEYSSGSPMWGVLPRTPTVHFKNHLIKSVEALHASCEVEIGDISMEDTSVLDSGIDTTPGTPRREITSIYQPMPSVGENYPTASSALYTNGH